MGNSVQVCRPEQHEELKTKSESKGPRTVVAVLSLSGLTLATPWAVARRLLHPWDFPGKNTEVDCHFLLQGNLPNPVIEPGSLALQVDSLLSEPPGKPNRLFPNIK